MNIRYLARSLACCALLGLSACGDDAAKEKPIVIDNTANNSTNNNGTVNNVGGNNTSTTNNSPNNVGGNNTTNVNDQCPEEARPVYVVEADIDTPENQGKLVRFDAKTLTFTDIGQLNCPVSLGDTPFSMSVDRTANAWVLYSSGDLYKVSTTDASCEATAFRPGQRGFEVFGMGFVLNRAGFPEETLYIAGGAESDIGSGAPQFGYINLSSLEVTEIGTIGGWPEMSGTANADLWAFFPNTAPPRVAQVTPATGEEIRSIPIELDGDANAWAFAHWGGRFWVFYKGFEDNSTRVFEVNPVDNSVQEVLPDTGRYIVGAGVSTCAPTIFL